MIDNIISNREWFPDLLREGQVTWLMPIAPESETSVWPVSVAVPLKGVARPGLVLANGTYNGSLKSNRQPDQPQKLLAATNAVTLSPWLLPYRTIGIYMNGVAINFVDITSLKQIEEELRQEQQRLELLNKDLTELVAERTEQVCQLVSEVLITEQKVKQDISHLLHDEIQQILFSIQMQTETLHSLLPVSEHVLLDQIQEIRNTVNLAYQVTRQVAVDLSLPFLLHQNFTESLDFLAALMEKMYGLKVALKGPQLSNWPKEEVGILLYQIVRELLFNVVKHAGVTQAQVEVAQEGDRLSIIVSDDGQGFDAAWAMKQRDSLGLFTIRRRLELFGGQCHIESQVGQGTRVTVVTLL